MRAPLIRWAFEQYASDQYSVWQLAGVLDDLGLTTRGSHKRPAHAVSASVLAKILRDPYYTGVVPFKGVLYPGRHPALFGFFQSLTLPLGIYASESDFADYEIRSQDLRDRIDTAVARTLPLVRSDDTASRLAEPEFARPDAF